MRVKKVSVTTDRLPLHLDLGGPYGTLESIGYVLVGLRDAEGHTGVGWTFSLDPQEVSGIEAALRERASAVVGVDAEGVEAHWPGLQQATAGLPRGVGAPTVSALDVALWDLRGRQRGEPLHRMLGAKTEQLRTYASDDMWQTLSAEVVAANARGFASQGFRTVKIRTGGSEDPAEEARRVAVVREAVGDEVEILYDALQIYNVETAIGIGRAIEPYGIGWFEDPVSERDLAGQAAVTAAVDVPVAAGEDTLWPEGHGQLIERAAVDVLMVDAKWVGGITPWLQVSRLAASRGLPMVSHISPELSGAVLAASATAGLLEWFSWSFGLYEQPPAVKDGVYTLPSGPGFGLRYRADLLDRLFG